MRQPRRAVPAHSEAAPGAAFSRLLAAQVVSAVGSQIRIVVLPFIAVSVLAAPAWQIGILNACGAAAFLFVGLPAGVLVDRGATRRILVIANVGAGGVSAVVLMAGLLGRLTITQLYLAEFLLGLALVVAGVAFLSFLPALVAPDRLVEATSRLTVVQTLAQVGGPAAAGALIASIGPIRALAVDTVSFFAAALLLATVAAGDQRTGGVPAATGVWRQIREGLRYVVSTPLLRTISATVAVTALFDAVWQAALMVFIVRELKVDALGIGVIFAISAVGGVAGSAAAPALIRRYGRDAALRRVMPATFAIGLVMTAAQPGPAAYLVAAADFVMMFGSLVFNIAQTSVRLEMCPPGMRGRMNATIRTGVWTCATLGALLGAGLAAILAPRWVIAIGVAATAVSSFVCLRQNHHRADGSHHE